MSLWYRFIKKYAWDDEKTPYLTRVANLTQEQANKEIFVYALFLTILFGVAALASIAGTRLQPGDQSMTAGLGGIQRGGQSFGVALYAATIFAAAIWLGAAKHPYAATYCGSAPVASFFYILADGFSRELGTLDKVGLISFTILWAWYSLRVTAIAKAYPGMPLTGPIEEAFGVEDEDPPEMEEK